MPADAGVKPAARGFTLIEMVMVITITGILAGMVAVFIQKPVIGYFDTIRRANLSDAADTALRRIARDLRLALPNSIRTTTAGGKQYVELLLTSGGGRYRAEPDSGGGGDPLDFNAADSSFDVIGPMPTFVGGEFIVVFNLFSDAASTSSNAYSGDNVATYGSNAGSTITLAAAKRFPFESPTRRFHVVLYPVTYECDTASGTVRRYWNYTRDINQPTPPAGGSSALLVNKVSACNFTYDTAVVAQRAGLVSLGLELTDEGETVRLHQQTHVSNYP